MAIMLLVFLVFGVGGLVIYLLLHIFVSESKKTAKDAVDFIASPEANRPLRWWEIILYSLFAGFSLYLCIKFFC